MSQGESLAAIPPVMPTSLPDAATPGATAPGENGEGMPFSLLFEVARNEVASDAGDADTPVDPAVLMAIVGQVTAADGEAAKTCRRSWRGRPNRCQPTVARICRRSRR